MARPETRPWRRWGDGRRCYTSSQKISFADRFTTHNLKGCAQRVAVLPARRRDRGMGHCWTSAEKSDETEGVGKKRLQSVQVLWAEDSSYRQEMGQADTSAEERRMGKYKRTYVRGGLSRQKRQTHA